jgi:hypothetical protein
MLGAYHFNLASLAHVGVSRRQLEALGVLFKPSSGMTDLLGHAVGQTMNLLGYAVGKHDFFWLFWYKFW